MTIRSGPEPLLPTTFIRLETIDEMISERHLEQLLGPIRSVEVEPMGSLGISGSLHHRVQVQLHSGGHIDLVFKYVRLQDVWTAYRTGDAVGREAALLGEPGLIGIWESITCPYLAYAMEPGQIGLLMRDLGDTLFPDVDTPLSQLDEDRLLSSLATMHARYWGTAVLETPFLTTMNEFFSVLGPGAGVEEIARMEPHPLFELVATGWERALSYVPDPIARLLQHPVDTVLRPYADLPRTIVHGDAKVGNFAIDHEGRVAAFDWAWVGAAPCTADLGWYLAVNAARLARPKGKVIARYRSFLESSLGDRISNALWDRLLAAGILCAAFMLLWNKALALDAGTEGAQAEWDWWMNQLSGIA